MRCAAAHRFDFHLVVQKLRFLLVNSASYLDLVLEHKDHHHDDDDGQKRSGTYANFLYLAFS